VFPDDSQAVYPPQPNVHFDVRIDGVSVPVRTVSGLFDFIKEREAADADGRVGTLTRAVTGDRRLFQWFVDARNGKDARYTVTIRLLSGETSKPLDEWALLEALPIRWCGPHFDAQHGEVAVETLYIRYASVEWPRPAKKPARKPAKKRSK